MPKIKVNDIDLYYEIYGQGSGVPLLLVGGLVADHNIWHSVAARFAKKHTVVIFDNRGIGQSSCPEQPFSIELMAEDAAALLEKLQLGAAHVVGSSMGGVIAQNMAYKYPHLVKSLILANSFYCPAKHERLKGVIKANVELRQANIVHPAIFKMFFVSLYSNNFLRLNSPIERLIDYALANPYPITNCGYINQAQALLAADTSALLSGIKQPCLIVAATEDMWSDMQQAQYLQKHLVNSQYFCFNDVGHLPHIEQPEVFSQLVLDFIANNVRK